MKKDKATQLADKLRKNSEKYGIPIKKKPKKEK